MQIPKWTALSVALFLPLLVIPGHGTPVDSWGVLEVCKPHRSKTFEQTVHFQTVDDDAKRVRIVNRERLDEESEWFETEMLLTASFGIRDVRSVKANELILWGFTDGWTECVVEYWVIEPIEGGRDVVRSIEPTPLGMPREPATLSETIVGGSWVEPAKRASTMPWVNRRELYRGKSVDLLWIDPDGRFLLMYLPSRKEVVRADLVTPGGIEVLLTVAEVPDLALGARAITPLGPRSSDTPYAGPGRAYRLVTGRVEQTRRGLNIEDGEPAYLIDADNDGAFDSVSAVPPRFEPR